MEPPRVKICGLTSVEDAGLAVEHGAWALGTILWKRSRRRCRPEDALAISRAFRRRAEIVGVFVDPGLDEVEEAADVLGLSMVQLHGDEGPAFCTEVGRRTGCRVVKAARVTGRAALADLGRFRIGVDLHLLDGPAGGSGQTWDWRLIGAHEPHAVPVVVAGGLTPENVGAAIAATAPYAVDVASGTEAEPGRKDPERLAAFFAAVRATAPEPAAPEPAPEPAAPGAEAAA